MSDRKIGQAVFAGGCFWGIEHLFRKTPGVLDVESGYTGGEVDNPTYEEVCTGRTGHAEAVRITYDPGVVTYHDLARRFFEFHDPTQLNRQGPDVGTQYRSAVFYANDEERETARYLIGLLQEMGYRIATTLEPLGPFWPAEDYHQRYLENHPQRFCHAPVKRFQ